MSTATMGDLDDISCKTCLQLKIVVLKASCCQTNSVKKTKQNKEISFWLFLYLNSEYVSEKDLSNQSLLKD